MNTSRNDRAAEKVWKRAVRFRRVRASKPVGTLRTQLGNQLQTTVRLIRAGIGARVIYVPFGGDFDTHEDHRSRHGALMSELNGALDAFLNELKTLNLTNRVLLASFSEFGRRVDQNTDGLDHGTSTAVLLTGAVRPGVYGQRPSFKNLDPDGNLVSTVTMGNYYATLASWLGVDPALVLPGTHAPIPGIF